MPLCGVNKKVVGAVAAAVLVAATVVAIAVISEDDDGDGATAAPTTSSVPDETTTSTTGDTTTTTAAPGATTTTTAARATTTTTGAATTTTTGTVAACGNGRAAVAFTAKDLATDALSSTFTPQVTVDNRVSAPIEVEEVSVEVSFPSGETRSVRFTTAGTVIAPATSASFTSDKVTSAQRYSGVRITRFTYFTAGLKESCRVSAP